MRRVAGNPIDHRVKGLVNVVHKAAHEPDKEKAPQYARKESRPRGLEEYQHEEADYNKAKPETYGI